MARINGSVGSNSDAYEFYIIWEESEVNIANNTSKVTATSYIYCKAHTAYNYNTYNHTITIDGQVFTTSVAGISLSPGVVKQLASASKVITHNADGSKSINISASSPNLPAGGGYGPSSGSASGTATLTTIPRTSSVTCADGNIGSSTTININRASSSFTHTLTYNFGGLTGTITTKTTNTSIGWTIPTTFFAKIPNSKSGKGTITCQTYNGNTLIGSSTCTFNAFVINSNPTVSATVQDVNSTTTALTGNANKIVKYFSNAKIVTTATPKNSATISSVKVVCSNKSATGTNVTINNVESNVFNITATDSRGLVTSTTVTKTLVNYIKCAITSIKLERLSTTSNTVKATINGNFFNASFGAKTNTLTLKWRYRIKGGTWNSYTNLTTTKSGNTFSYSGNLGTNFDFQEEYDFEVVATDLLMSETRTIHVTRGIPIIDIGKNDAKVNGDLEVSNKITSKYGFRGFLLSRGAISSESGGQHSTDSGLSVRQVYNNGYPIAYGNCINVKGSGSSQLLLGWEGTSKRGKIYYRSLRDVTTDGTTWSSWGRMYTHNILYDNSSGTTGTVTLSENATDYDYLEIYFRTNDNWTSSIKCMTSSGTQVNLIATFINETYLYLKVNKITINGNSITRQMGTETKSGNSGNIHSVINNIYITKVAGYR